MTTHVHQLETQNFAWTQVQKLCIAMVTLTDSKYIMFFILMEGHNYYFAGGTGYDTNARVILL